MKLGPTKEEQLEALNAELLAACKLAHYYSEDLDQTTARAIKAAIAKAEAFKNQQP